MTMPAHKGVVDQSQDEIELVLSGGWAQIWGAGDWR